MSAAPTSTIHLKTCWIDLARRRICRDGDQEVQLSRLEAGLLQYLVDRPNQDVARDDLLQDVWGYSSATTSRAVDFVVNRVRQKLGEPDPPEHLLTSHGVGYRFVPLAPDCALATTPSPPRTLVRTAGGIVDLDRQSFERADGVLVPLTRLDAAIVRALAAREGRPIPLEDLATELWGRGRHRQSLAMAMARLRKKLEVDPARPEVIVTTRGVGVRLEGDRTTRGERTNLAPVESSYVESADLQAMLDAAARHPVLTVRGTGGIGKTRLARQAGGRLLVTEPTIEVWFCDLASVSEERGIAETVAQTIGLDPAGQDLVERLGVVLSRRPAGSVLILDNYEHLMPYASLVPTWRAAAPDLRFWVTSRTALGIADEVCLDVKPLDEDGAARLFADRNSRRSDADSPAVRALVRRLDGLPLAIELAAARAHQLTPEGLLARIGERLDLLVRPTSEVLSHHATLRGAFDWSWDLLPADERKALARLSVLVSPFDETIATALLGEHGLLLVARLVARSLVHGEGDGRWRLFEAIREYAGEKLVLMGEREAALRERASWFLDRAEQLVAALDGEEAGTALAGLRSLRDEVLAVYSAAADADTAARAVLVMPEAHERTAHSALLAELLQGAIARSPGPRWAWQLWWHLSRTSTSQGAHDRARDQLAEAGRLARLHSGLASAIVLRQSALNRALLGKDEEAGRMLLAARAAFLALGERVWAARSLGNYARIQLRTNGWFRTIEMFEQASTEARDAGDVRNLPVLLSGLADSLQIYGRGEEAREVLGEALQIAMSCGDVLTELRTSDKLAALDAETGALAAAGRQYLANQRRYRGMGFVGDEDRVASERGMIALECERLEEAETLVASRTLRGAKESRIVRLANLAVLRLFEGDAIGARERLLRLDLTPEKQLCCWTWANCWLALASAMLGDIEDAETRLADMKSRFDPARFGVARFLELCDAFVDYARNRVADPGAVERARSVLGRGTLVATDAGLTVERPQDVNLARMLLVRFLEQPVV